jgi:hypothetical protein
VDASDRDTGDLARELRALGENLKEVFTAAWESEDRKHMQGELEEGLGELATSLRSAAEEFAASDTGRRLKEDMRDLEARVRSGETSSRVREDLLSALRTVNEELGRAAENLGGGRNPSGGEKTG